MKLVANKTMTNTRGKKTGHLRTYKLRKFPTKNGFGPITMENFKKE